MVAAFAAALIIGQRRRWRLQREFSRRLLVAQEDERARIARDLHDDALQRVALLRHEMEELGTRLVAPAQQNERHRIDSIVVELQDLGLTLRGLAHQLHPSIVGQVGLVRSLEVLAGDLQRASGLEVTVAVSPEDLTVPPEAGLTAYRITQEALRNIVIHAGTSSARVAVTRDRRGLVLQISDRGRGFDQSAGSRSGGLGLTAMQERAAAAGGSVRILSRVGEGTLIEVTLPVGAS